VATNYVRKVKREGGTGLWGAYELDRDEHGVWLYTPVASLYRGTSGSQVDYCHAGWPDPPGAAMVQLVPHEQWWFARWQRTPPSAHVAIDICTPAQLSEGTWTYGDLELDLLLFATGRWALEDQDDFESVRAAGLIDDDEAIEALATARDLAKRLDTRDPLFNRIGWQRLQSSVDLNLPGIVDLPD
jgi:Protein of unknown function (DUF402)